MMQPTCVREVGGIHVLQYWEYSRVTTSTREIYLHVVRYRGRYTKWRTHLDHGRYRDGRKGSPDAVVAIYSLLSPARLRIDAEYVPKE